MLKNFRSRIRLRKLEIFSTANNYDAYYTPRHSTCSCLALTLATVYFPVAKTTNTHATAFDRGKCSMIVPSFFTATAYRSEGFLGSLSHTNASPAVAAHTFYIRGSRECNFFRKTFPWQLLSPYVLPDFCVVKFSC